MPVKPDRDITNPQIAKAMAHPLRVRILGILDERVASPSELAEELNADLGVVSYHVRTLARAGLLKLVRKKQRRGAVEHFYKAAERPVITDDAWRSMPSIVKQAAVGQALNEIAERVSTAAGAGGFDRDDMHMTQSPVTVDAKGWSEISKTLDKARKDLETIAKRSSERLAKSGDEGAIDAAVVLMFFENASVPKPKPKASQAALANPSSRVARAASSRRRTS
jgi:DNA-binding transcriptional ArsR family regulator